MFVSLVSYFPIIYLISHYKFFAILTHTSAPCCCLPFFFQLLTQFFFLSPLLSDRARLDPGSEEIQKRYVQDVQGTLAAEVARQLDDFRWESYIFTAIQHFSEKTIPKITFLNVL